MSVLYLSLTYSNHIPPITSCADVFAFDIYDSDADGILKLKEVQLMFRELMGSKVFEMETSKA